MKHATLACVAAAASLSASVAPAGELAAGGGPFVLATLPSIGTVTWRCEAGGRAGRYGLGFSALEGGATNGVAWHAGIARVTATVQPGASRRFPLTSAAVQLLEVSQPTEARTLRASLVVRFRGVGTPAESHCFGYLPPTLTLRLTTGR
jgi:hypothetical protein